MKKKTYQRTGKSWISGIMAIVLLIALFPTAPSRALAAGTLTVVKADPTAGAGDTTDINVTYSNNALLSLGLGAFDFVLPEGIKATTSDRINGTPLIQSQILDNGKRVRLSGLTLSLLQSTNTLSLQQKTLPAAGTYPFETKAYGLSVTLQILTTPLETQLANLNIPALELPLSSLNAANNSGNSDTLAVSNLKSGDIVKVYNPDGSLRKQLTAQSAGTLSIPLILDPTGGTLDVSLTRGGIESPRIPIIYSAEIVSPIPFASVNVTNKSGGSDTVTIGGLLPGDRFRVYRTLTGTAVAAESTEIQPGQTQASVTLPLTALGGTVYVSRIHNTVESLRTPVSYLPEVVEALTSDLVTLRNTSGNSDRIRVTGLQSGDTVRVYASDGRLLKDIASDSNGIAEGTAALNPGGGSVNLVLVRSGIESPALPVIYAAEIVGKLLSSDVVVTNDPDDRDLIKVTGLEPGDQIRLQIGTGTPITSDPAEGGAIDIPAKLLPNGGSVTLSILRNTIEGPRLTLLYDPERVNPPAASRIAVVNHSGDADTVTVSDLAAGDVIIVYDAASGGTELGRAIEGAAGSANLAQASVQLSPAGGTAYVSILRHGVISTRTPAIYNAENVAAPSVDNVTVENAPYEADTVTVSSLRAGDRVNVYQAEGTLLIGSAAAEGANGTYSASLSGVGLNPAGGSIRVSLVRNTIESPQTPVVYAAETVPAPPASTIGIVNLAGAGSDKITVEGLRADDRIRIYQGAAAPLEARETGGTASIGLTLNPRETLGISIVRNGIESPRTTMTYPLEVAGFSGTASAVNQEGGSSDRFVLTGLEAGDEVIVYSREGGINGGGTELARETVSSSSGSLIFENLTLTPSGGTLSFTFEREGSQLSGPYDVVYGPEPVSPLTVDDVAAVNAPFDADRVTLSNLTLGDTVIVYEAAANGTLTELDRVSAGADGTAVAEVTLKPGGGTIAVVLARSGLNSPAVKVNYGAEVVPPPGIASVRIANGDGPGGDTVTVEGLMEGDRISVISYRADGTRLDSGEEQAENEAEAAVRLELLPEGGHVTVAIIRNTIISQATSATYGPENVAPPAAEDITVINRPGIPDRVEVKGLLASDVVTVLSYNEAGEEVDRAEVSADAASEQLAVDLAPAGGYIEVFITRYGSGGLGGVSSTATRIAYGAEIVPSPSADSVTVTNNTGTADRVVVADLEPGDRIRVYTADGTDLLGTAESVSGTATAELALIPAGGSVRVVLVRNTLESQGTLVPYLSEILTAPDEASIAIVNEEGTSDRVTVSGLLAGDIVSVTAGGEEFTSAAAASDGTVTTPVTLSASGGVAQIALIRSGVVSLPVQVTYSAESLPAPPAANIRVSNLPNAGGDRDTVTLSGAVPGDWIRVYDVQYALIGSGQAEGPEVEVEIASNLDTIGGTLYVTIERGGVLSGYTPVGYEAETVEPIDPLRVQADNTQGDDDTLRVAGLNPGESVRVYRANGQLAASFDYTGSDTNIALRFEPGGETLTLVRVRSGIESTGAAYPVPAETVPGIAGADAAVRNNAGPLDTVTVSVDADQVLAADAYVVYDEAGNLLGRSDGYQNGSFTISLTLVQTGGSVRVALERRGVVGPPTEIAYPAEAAVPNEGPIAGDITVTNSRGNADPVVVDKVLAGDIVVVYGADGAERGRSEAATDGSLTILVNLADDAGGDLELSVIREGIESLRTSKAYAAYDPDQPPVLLAAQITVVRSGDSAQEDQVTVTGLEAADEVEFFDDENIKIGKETANASGIAVLRTFDLKSYASTLKLNVRRGGVSGGPLAVSYPAENSTVEAPASGNITVKNAAGTSGDTVTVSGVLGGDRVRVYTSNGAELLGEAAAVGTTAVAPVSLGETSGSVRVSIVRGGSESAGTLKPYAAEPTVTPAPAAVDITAVNAAGTINDTITVLGVASGDIVRVYSADGSLELGERTSTGTSVMIHAVLAAAGGTVGVSVERGGFESVRTPVSYGAEKAQRPDAPAAGSLTAVNEIGTASDRVTVTGVQAGDLVRIYAAGDTPALGQAVAAGTSVTIPVGLDAAGGRVTATIERGGEESEPSAAVVYDGDPAPEPPAASSITVTNGTGTLTDQVVIVEGVKAGDLVRVYDGESSVLLGQQVAAGPSVTIPVELNADGGEVTVTIEREGVESQPSAAIEYTSDPVPQPPAAANITVTNGIGTLADRIVVDGVQAGDLVRVYDASGTSLLGQHLAEGTSVTISVELAEAGGRVTVTVQRSGIESAPSAEVVYDREPAAPAAPEPPAGSNITVINGAGTFTDKVVVVEGVAVSDLVRVYDENDGRLLGQHLAEGTSVTIPVELDAGGGRITVTIERGGAESEPSTAVEYSSDPIVEPPAEAAIEVSNQAGTAADVVTISSGLQANDLVRVYAADGTTQLGQQTVSAGSVRIPVILTTESGVLKVTITRGGVESDARDVSYEAEAVEPPAVGSVSVATDVYGGGSITVSGIQAGDTVVLNIAGVLLEQTVLASGSVTITATDDTFDRAGGTFEVFVRRGTIESSRVAIDYAAAVEEAVQPPTQISVIRLEPDRGSVTVGGLNDGDLLWVTGAGGSIATSAPAAGGRASVEVSLSPGGGALDLYVQRGSETSSTVAFAYDSIPVNAPAAGSITAVNNPGPADTVIVNGAVEGDTVTVYLAGQTQPLEQAVVGSGEGGRFELPVELTTGAGSVEVTFTRSGVESARTAAGYDAEPERPVAPPLADSIVVVNNPGLNDRVTVEGLEEGDTVNVYGVQGVLLGQATADASGRVILAVTLIEGGGQIEAAIIRGLTQSGRTTKNYAAEDPGAVTPPAANLITVVNNRGLNDSVQVGGLNPGDTVTVYTAEGTVLGQAAADETGSAVVSVTLTEAGGELEVALTRGSVQSGRTNKTYTQEEQAEVEAPDRNQITVLNNAGLNDSVVAQGLEADDVVTVYTSGGAVLGRAAADASGKATIEAALERAGGRLEVTVTRGGVQSARTEIEYDEEDAGTPGPQIVIEVTNNLGSQDTVIVSNVQTGDIVTVYGANGTTILARVTAASAGTLTIPVTLPNEEDRVAVSVIRGGVEQLPVEGTYTSEPTVLAAPEAGTITAANNTGTSDSVALTGLQAGDIVTVYASNGTTILNRIRVDADPSTWTVSVTLNPEGGSIQVSIIKGNVESGRTTISYGAESSSVPALPAASVTVVNNGGSGSSVTVSGAQPGDVVTVYGSNGTTIIGRGQVEPGSDRITIPVTLDEAGGSLQVTVTRGTVQSPATPIVYPARIEQEQPGTGGGTDGGGGTGGGGGPTPAGPAAAPTPPANPVTPATNPVTPEMAGESEEIDAPGRVVALTVREPRTFNDISGYWAQAAIERLTSLGVIDGKPDGSFAPREQVSRAQFTKMLASLLDIKSQQTPTFADTPANRWYTESIQGAYEQGIVSGYTGGRFDPDETITREEMAKMVMNAMLWLNPDVFEGSPDYASAEAFRDYNRVGNWAKEPVSRMLEEGILIGKTNGVLDPKGQATRAEAAAVLTRLLERMSGSFDFS